VRGGHVIRAERTPVRPPTPTRLVPIGWTEVPSPNAGERVFEQFGVAMGLTPPGATLEEVAAALSRSAAPRPENWSWPARPVGMAASGRPEPVRAAFCRFLETGEPYYTEED